MTISRRRFLQLAAGASAALLPGCREFPVREWFGAARENGPFRMPEGEAAGECAHVLSRCTFGPRPGGYERVAALGAEAWIEAQLAPDQIDDSHCDYLLRRLETLRLPVGELFEYKARYLQTELSRAALLRAVYSERQLYEVMVEFWSDHFNIAQSKGDCPWLKVADDRDVIRRHALGRFPELLRASALSPAMLWYLDGRANKRRNQDEKPNENYARELLELHTLGVHGGYTQQDVMEIARCLTGWTVRSNEWFGKGRVEFRKQWHDQDEKQALGRAIPSGQGEGDLDTVLSLVCEHPSTAKYLAWKLCRRFIRDDPPDSAVAAVAEAYRQTGGDIPAMLRAVFATEAFQLARGEKLKRPFHFVASALRATGADTDIGEPLLDYLLRMGHAPFQYPTPDGYPLEAAPWTGSLLWRWHFALALGEGRIPGVRVRWNELAHRAGGEEGLMAHLLGRPPLNSEREAYRQWKPGGAVLMATPAFQWC